jgi:hypothetical protein
VFFKSTLFVSLVLFCVVLSECGVSEF